jgi:5-methyltetrahydropteroyltriglutamate--homocysteine methyltransferase
MAAPLLTTVVGSYPQPEWLIDRRRLLERLPPRVRDRELWLVERPRLEQAQDETTIEAVRDMERAGIDVITDGEIRRESYSNRFATALTGLDLDNPGTFVERNGMENFVPRVVGPIRRTRPVEVRDVQVLRAATDRLTKATVPGPFTMSQQAVDEHYHDQHALALAFAEAVNAEIHDLFAAGVDIVQLDEPYLQARPEQARAYAVEAITRALDGVRGRTALHTCFGYAHYATSDKSNRGGYPFFAELNDIPVDQLVIEAAQPRLDLALLTEITDKDIAVGVLDLGDPQVESAETVAERIRAALEHVEPHRLSVSPDCGMKFLSREVALGKLRALADGARVVRAEL